MHTGKKPKSLHKSQFVDIQTITWYKQHFISFILGFGEDGVPFEVITSLAISVVRQLSKTSHLLLASHMQRIRLIAWEITGPSYAV